MKRTVLVVSLAAFVAGCESMPSMTEAQKSAGVGAAIGCAGAALIGKITGGSAGAACVGGAVVGGLAGYIHGREQDLKVAQEIKQDFPGAEVKTHEVTVTEGTTTKKVTAMRSVSVPMPQGAMADPNGQEVLKKLVDRAASMNEPVTVTVTASSAADRAAATKIMAGDAYPNVKTKVVSMVATKGMTVSIEPQNTAERVTI